MVSEPSGPRRIGIIGSGFSGLCLGIQLRRAGIESFTIFEKAADPGGTWRDNTYPGAACDSPSFAYCFSFEQKTDWSRKWAPQAEILAYMEHCAEKYGLGPHLRFGTEIESARFDEPRGEWHLRSTAGETFAVDVLVSSVGQLNRPRIPDIPGLDEFEGVMFHSAQWDHGVDLGPKSVAVIGNAASAIQFVPRLAQRVKHLTIFQRSANWMLPKRDRVYSEHQKRRFGRRPWLAKLYRWWIWLSFELRFPVFRGNRFFGRHLERLAEREMRAVVEDPQLQDALVPNHPIGGKRILISDDYYPTLNRSNVDVVTSGVGKITRKGVVDGDGREVPVDAIILATGFRSTEFLAPMEIVGRGGRRLSDVWRDAPRAYLGLAVPGFPNFFMTYGPNTNLGHNSIIFMIECQTHYIVSCIREIFDQGLRFVDVKPAALEDFDRRTQAELAHTVWADTPASWYKTRDGRITNNWSGTTTRYWWRTRRVDWDAFERVAAAHPD